MSPRVRWCLALCFVLSATIIAAGCTRQQAILESAPATPAETPQSLEAAGRFEDARERYLQLAGSGGPEAAEAALKAALIEADLGRLQEAARHRGAAPGSADTPRALLALGLASLAGETPDEALFTLNSISPENFDAYERGLFLRALGRAQFTAGDRAALLNLINAELFPLPPGRRTELTHLIWEALKRSDDPALASKLDARNANLTGWLALKAQVANQGATPEALRAALTAWQLAYPAHPANELLVDEILELAERQGGPVRRVTLLLPLSGELAPYAAAVRDGFNTQRLISGDLGLEVRIVDASGSGVITSYREAASNGSQVVVGPLDKPGVEALAHLLDRPIPVLALNSPATAPATANASPGLFPAFSWFALAPEDDAEDLAHRAWRDGHRRMATLVPNTDLGSRVRTAFVASWEQLGGQLVEDSRYSPSADAYKEAIRKTFSFAQSEARAAFIRSTLKLPIVFEAKPRTDLDAVMLVADPVSARQIIPQFRYLGVDKVPIYATSQIYGGWPNSAADADLNGVRFAARPWDMAVSGPTARQIFERFWPAADPLQRQLFAFGIDAHLLLRELPGMAADPARRMQANTGTLRRDTSGRLRRELAWARFVEGLPELLPP